MTIWSWMRLAAGLWLIRKAVKAAGWLLLFAGVIAAWPLTLVILAGYVTAWWRGWPPARLRRAAAWALPEALAWLLAQYVLGRTWQAAALTPGRAWEHSWPPHPSALAAARTFVLLAPAVIPAGLGLAAAVWAWRNYAITTGLGGVMASAPIVFDARQWKRQVRTARGLTEAPGAVPLLARGGRIPVGGTIRAIGHRWDPVFTLPAAALARHMVIVGATGLGKTNLIAGADEQAALAEPLVAHAGGVVLEVAQGGLNLVFPERRRGGTCGRRRRCRRCTRSRGLAGGRRAIHPCRRRA